MPTYETNIPIGYFDQFNKDILDIVTPLIQQATNENYDDVKSSIYSDLFGVGEKPIIAHKQSPEELFTMRIFQLFIDISKTFEAIKESKYYISVFPFRADKVTKSNYLNLIYTSFFHEIYLLRERLEKFIPNIIKGHNNTEYHKKGKLIASELKKNIRLTFKGASKLRNNHVHDFRLEDKRIEKLSSLELLLLTDNEDFKNAIHEFYTIEFKTIRKEIKNEMLSTIKEIENSLITTSTMSVHFFSKTRK